MVFVPSTFLPEYRVARKYSVLSSDGWWLNRWPFLGWLETIVKLAAFFVSAYVPRDAARARIAPAELLDDPAFFFELVLMAGGTLLLAAGILDRLLLYREVVSMVFVFPNVWAHWNIVLAMARLGRSGISSRNFRAFCYLMLLGDVVKLVFFAWHDFSMLNIARYVLYLLVFAYAILYTLVLLLEFGYFRTIARDLIGLAVTFIPEKLWDF